MSTTVTTTPATLNGLDLAQLHGTVGLLQQQPALARIASGAAAVPDADTIVVAGAVMPDAIVVAGAVTRRATPRAALC